MYFVFIYPGKLRPKMLDINWCKPSNYGLRDILCCVKANWSQLQHGILRSIPLSIVSPYQLGKLELLKSWHHLRSCPVYKQEFLCYFFCRNTPIAWWPFKPSCRDAQSCDINLQCWSDSLPTRFAKTILSIQFRHTTLCPYASKSVCSITSVYIQGKS